MNFIALGLFVTDHYLLSNVYFLLKHWISINISPNLVMDITQYICLFDFQGRETQLKWDFH